MRDRLTFGEDVGISSTPRPARPCPVGSRCRRWCRRERRTIARSARWARIVHIGSLVILALALLAIVVGFLAGDGGGDVDPSGPPHRRRRRLLDARTAHRHQGRNVLGWVFLVMGAALALGLPAEGYLDVAFREPYVASLPGTEMAGLLANAFPA